MEETCSICIEPISGINFTRTLTRTHFGHTFHSDCLLQLALSDSSNKNSCPNCRETLVPINLKENGVIMFDNLTLKTAVHLWIQNSVKAQLLYGHISNWNVSRVTDMSCMFNHACMTYVA